MNMYDQVKCLMRPEHPPGRGRAPLRGLEVLNKVLGFLPPINVGKWGKLRQGAGQRGRAEKAPSRSNKGEEKSVKMTEFSSM